MQAEFEQAIVRFRSGDLAGARSACLAVLEAAPRHPEALRMLGLIALRNRRPARAAEFFERAIASQPDRAILRLELGIALDRMKRGRAAIACFEKALELDPTLRRAHLQLTGALVRTGRYAEAVAACDRALVHLSGSDVLLNNRAAALIHQGRPEAALSDIERALAINPANFGALKNRGAALQAAGRDEEAILWCNRALEKRPEDAGPHLNRGIARLRQGDLVAGFLDYEWRWRTTGSGMGRNRHAALPQWTGQSLAGRSVLLHAEQGLGDSIQFMRYVPRVAAQAAQTILALPEPLLALARDSFGPAVSVVSNAGTIPETDFQCPMMSLARAFGTDLRSIPASMPYLRADPERVARFANRLGVGAAARVGIVWSGSRAHHNDANRSLPLSRLLPLFDSGPRFICLQKEVDDVDRARLAGIRDVTLVDDILGDFADTAAIVASLDLVISVDTSVAHLAGALGCPLWLALPKVADWRWLTERDDSPWYPGARLFRQRSAGDWDELVARLGEQIRIWSRSGESGREKRER